MDPQEFRDFAKAVVDYIADYYENIRERQVLPSVTPGYLEPLMPEEAPQKGEKWQEILKDVERIIMPGVTHWLSPNFHAYYPTANSFPAIVGEMLSAGIGSIGFSWMSSPACTELEVAMMNWLGKMLGLPEEFLNCHEGPGGGVIQGTASEATLVGLLAAKDKTVNDVRAKHPELSEAEVKGKLVAYTSDQSNSSVEKAGLLGSMPMRLLQSDEDGRLRGETLREAIKKDREAGLIPCYVVATLGSTGTCAFDALDEIGPLCKEENVWLHVDAAYAGTAFVCPEYRYLMNGVEYADSFNFNCHKWMLVNFDCSAMWFKNAKYVVQAFNVERIYLQHKHQGFTPEYRHWQIPLGRRFRSLKLWFVLRTYGVEGIQNHVRGQIALAQRFEKLVCDDERFELRTSSMGLLSFRLKGDDSLTHTLLDQITNDKNLYLIPCHHRGDLVIRFCICSVLTNKDDIDFAWNEISKKADEIVGPRRHSLENNILSTVIGEKKNLAGIDIRSNGCEKTCGMEKTK